MYKGHVGGPERHAEQRRGRNAKKMPWRNPPNRSAEYRKRAEEARARADSTTDEKERAALLQAADTWERMADWEDKNNPTPGSN
jgi:hypothetical protein